MNIGEGSGEGGHQIAPGSRLADDGKRFGVYGGAMDVFSVSETALQTQFSRRYLFYNLGGGPGGGLIMPGRAPYKAGGFINMVVLQGNM